MGNKDHLNRVRCWKLHDNTGFTTHECFTTQSAGFASLLLVIHFRHEDNCTLPFSSRERAAWHRCGFLLMNSVLITAQMFILVFAWRTHYPRFPKTITHFESSHYGTVLHFASVHLKPCPKFVCSSVILSKFCLTFIFLSHWSLLIHSASLSFQRATVSASWVKHCCTALKSPPSRFWVLIKVEAFFKKSKPFNWVKNIGVWKHIVFFFFPSLCVCPSAATAELESAAKTDFSLSITTWIHSLLTSGR